MAFPLEETGLEQGTEVVSDRRLGQADFTVQVAVDPDRLSAWLRRRTWIACSVYSAALP